MPSQPTLSQLSKAWLSRHRIFQKSSQDLGKQQALDLRARSKHNLKQLKQRLRDCHLLPIKERHALKTELQQTGTFLTKTEITLYEKLLNYDYFIYHTGISSVFEKILADSTPTLNDPAEATRRNISIENQVTPEFCGAEHNIYFNIGTAQISLPSFVRFRQDNDAEKILDYTTVKANFSKIMREFRHVLTGAWCSGHFAHYMLGTDAIMAPIILGSTQFYWQHKIENPLSQTEKKYKKILNFIRSDDTKIQLNIEIGDEIAFEGDIFPFISLSFIEILRYISGNMRNQLLETLDEKLINQFIEIFFHADSFEIHIPTQFPLDNPFVEIIRPQDRKAITTAVTHAAKTGDLEKLMILKNAGAPLDGYMYEDNYQFDSSGATTLPIVAAIQMKHTDVIQWLISQGANSRVFNNLENANLYATADGSIFSSQELMMILAATIESKEPAILNLLLQNGLNINQYQDSEIKELSHKILHQKFTFSSVSNAIDQIKNSDFTFLAIIQACAKANTTDALDILLPCLDYCKRPEFYNTVFQEVAMMGSSLIFNYFLIQAPIEIVSSLPYHQLFLIAVQAGNDMILDFLYQKTLSGSLKIEEECTILERAVSAYKKGFIKTGNWLLQRHDIPFSAMHTELHSILSNHELTENQFNDFIKWLIGESKYPVTQKILWHSGKSTTLVEYCLKENKINATKYIIETCYKNLVYTDEALKCNVVTLAFENNDIVLVDYLLEKGGELHEPQARLENAVRQGNEKSVEWLLAHGISPINSILEISLAGKSLKIIKLLLQAGATLPERTPQVDSLVTWSKFRKELYQIPIARIYCDIVQRYPALQPTIQHIIQNYGFKDLRNRYNASYQLEPIDSIDAKIHSITDVKLFKQAILAASVEVLDYLHKNYTFIPTLFVDEIVNLADDVREKNHVIQKVKWLASHGISFEQKNSEEINFIEKILTRKVVYSCDAMLLQIAEDHGVILTPYLHQHGGTMLIRAIQQHALSDTWEVIHWLVNHNVHIDSIYDIEVRTTNGLEKQGITPLEAASGIHNLRLVEALLERGANPNLVSTEGKSALHLACAENKNSSFSPVAFDDKVVLLLCQYGARVNYGQCSPLLVLCSHNPINLPLMERLLSEYHADPNYGAVAPLDFLITDEDTLQLEAATLLVKYGAKLNSQALDSNLTLHEYICQHKPEYLSLLKQSTATISQSNLFFSDENTQIYPETQPLTTSNAADHPCAGARCTTTPLFHRGRENQ